VPGRQPGSQRRRLGRRLSRSNHRVEIHLRSNPLAACTGRG
jgi:hypothetical protein